jgi:hypothetical protein
VGGAYNKKSMGDIFLGSDFLVGVPRNLELCNGLMQEMLKNRDEHRKDTNERGS